MPKLIKKIGIVYMACHKVIADEFRKIVPKNEKIQYAVDEALKLYTDKKKGEQ